MDRRHVRGGGRRELARQLRHLPFVASPFEERMLGMPLVPLPAERVEVHDHDPLVAPGQPSEVEWAARGSFRSGPAGPSRAACRSTRCRRRVSARRSRPRASPPRRVTLTAGSAKSGSIRRCRTSRRVRNGDAGGDGDAAARDRPSRRVGGVAREHAAGVRARDRARRRLRGVRRSGAARRRARRDPQPARACGAFRRWRGCSISAAAGSG